ncbi:protein ZNF783-like [Mauremys mutica]|uniref:protein ZNF783-like n=1 Tax=Mauremys mutica TaxID=74926 RepID=UPI001D165044|nr:protein ZNF783-like [Mauremys mutica]
MSEGLSRKVPVTFDDVAVYFSAEEWEILAEWQRELYKEVMKENLEAVLSLGFQIPRPGVVSLMERGGEACVQYPRDPAPETHFEGNGFLGPSIGLLSSRSSQEKPPLYPAVMHVPTWLPAGEGS